MKTIAASWGSRLSRAWLIFFFLGGANQSFAIGLDFDKTFSTVGERQQIHYRAGYSLNGQSHEVEVWRDHNQRLRRRTDEKVESFIFKPARKAEWQMVVLDLQRKIRTDIDRTNLYRIGHFTDWFSLSHSLSRPSGAFILNAISEVATDTKPAALCRWYALVRENVESKICWSTDLRLPMLITDSKNNLQWQITAFDSRPLSASTFAINDRGFVRNNANEDIQVD